MIVRRPDDGDAVLKIRGGGSGLLDPTIAAKALVSTVGAQAAFAFLASDKNSEAYGFPSSEPAWNDVLSLDNDGVFGACAALMGLQLFLGMSHQEAVGWSVIPYVSQILYKLLNDKYKGAGMTNDKGWLLFAINGLTMYACLSNAKWASKWINFYGGFSLLNALVLEASPETGCKSWGLTFSNMGMRDIGCRTIAANLAGHAALVAGPLLFGWTMLESIGWYAATFCITIPSMLFVTKDFDKLGDSFNTKALFVWIGLMAIVAGTILL